MLAYPHTKRFIQYIHESDAAFITRIALLKQKPSKSTLPVHILNKIEKHYKLRPDWIRVEYTNKSLMPWHGGVTVIEELDNNIIEAKIQIRKDKSLFSLYDPNEILLHEAIHMLRMSFPESIYEEILAYRLSDKKWRRYWGALFYSPRITVLFLVSLLNISSSDLAAIILNSETIWLYATISKAIPILILSFLGLKVARAQKNLLKCEEKLSRIFGLENVWPKIIRMSSEEINSVNINNDDVVKQMLSSSDSDI